MRPKPVLVPVCQLGCGTNTAAVEDARSGRVVQLVNPRLKLLGIYVYAAGHATEEADGLHRVRFGGPWEVAWCEAIPDAPAAAGTVA